jgi:hypothetical protein
MPVLDPGSAQRMLGATCKRSTSHEWCGNAGQRASKQRAPTAQIDSNKWHALVLLVSTYVFKK